MATLLDALNAGLGFTSNALSIQDSINRENANIRIQSAQLDFQTKTNDFLRSLEERSDYNNFEQDLDAFLNDYTSTANKLAKSPYEAQAVNQMLQSSRVSLQDKIRDVTLQAQKNDTILTNQENELKRQQLKKDGIITSSQQMEQSQAETNQMYLSGVLDQETAMIKNKQIVTTCFGDDVLTAGYDILDKGGSLEEALNAIDNMSTEEYKAYLTDANTNVNEDLFVDFDSLKANAKKELQGYWNTAIKSMQEKNVQYLSEIYSRLMMADPTEYNAILKQGQDTLMSMNGNKLSTTDREKYSRYFKEVEDKITSSSSSGMSVKQTAFGTTLNDYYDIAMAMAENGVIQPNDIPTVIQEMAYKGLERGEIKGFGALSREEAEQVLNTNSEAYVFFTNLSDNIYNDVSSNFPLLKSKLSKIKTQATNGELSLGAYDYVLKGMEDWIINKHINNLTEEECILQFDKMLNAANLETITILNNKALKEKEVAQFVDTLNNTDEAYTKDGKTVFANELSEEILYQSGGGIDKMGSILAETLGVDKSKVHHSKTMKDGDVDYEAKFEVDGKQYEFRTTTEKTLFGEKPTYEIVDENGNVVEGKSNAELRAEERERELQARQASTRAFGETATLSYEQSKRVDVDNIDLTKAVQPEIAENVINWIDEGKQGYNKLLTQLGLSMTQWMNLSQEEKRNKLIY